MKTPEEIKKGLYHCGAFDVSCTGCPYDGMDGLCEDGMEEDALAYIKQLEQRLAQAERERDAAVNDLEELTTRVSSLHLDCDYCKDKDKPVCRTCEWKWRGVCKENSKEENNG